jgi:hypothetical protein
MLVPILDLVESGTLPTTETFATPAPRTGRQQRVKRQSVTATRERQARVATRATIAASASQHVSFDQHPTVSTSSTSQAPESPPPTPKSTAAATVPMRTPTPIISFDPTPTPTPAMTPLTTPRMTVKSAARENISSGVVIIPDRYRSFQRDSASTFSAANKPPSAPRLPNDVLQDQLTWWQLEFLDLQMLYERPWFAFMQKVIGISQRPAKDFIILQVRDGVAEKGSEISTQTLDAFSGQLSRGTFQGESPFVDRSGGPGGGGGGGGLFGSAPSGMPAFGGGGGAGPPPPPPPSGGAGVGGGGGGAPGMDDEMGPEDVPTPAELARRINSTVFENVRQTDLEQSAARSADGRPQFVQSGARYEKLRKKLGDLHDREYILDKASRNAALRKTLRDAGSAASSWITRLQASGIAVINPIYFGAYDLVFAHARTLTSGRTFSLAPDTAFTRIRDMNRDRVSYDVSTFMASAVARMLSIDRNLAGIGLRQPKDRQALYDDLNNVLRLFVYRFGYNVSTDTFYDVGPRNDERTIPINQRASELALVYARTNVIGGYSSGTYAHTAARSGEDPITLDIFHALDCRSRPY